MHYFRDVLIDEYTARQAVVYTGYGGQRRARLVCVWDLFDAAGHLVAAALTNLAEVRAVIKAITI